MSADRRTLNRLATRQKISNVATQLFQEKGFDQVTIDEIARQAEVGRMTVFNHFPRKEDMFFEREDEGREILRLALHLRDTSLDAVEALRRLAHHLVEQDSPLVSFSSASQGFVSTIEKSESLKARVRAIRDEFTHDLAQALAVANGESADNPKIFLTATLILATWSSALIQGHRLFRQSQNGPAATELFLKLIDDGFAGVQAAMHHSG